MKLIEYHPKKIIVDVRNIPAGMSINECFNLLKSSPYYVGEFKAIEVDGYPSPWVHPDYKVKEENKFIVGHDPYNTGNDEHLGSISVFKRQKPDSCKGTSTNHMWGFFDDPVGLNEVNLEVWETAKPKFNERLINQLDRVPIIFATSRKKAVRENFINDDFWDIHILSESPMQEIDWIERKRKYPSLTVQDLQWVDAMVDRIFKKHTSPDLSKLKNFESKFIMHEAFHPAIPFDRYIFPF